MSWFRNPGRIAGLVYLSMVLTGPLTLIYIPGKLFVRGDAAATAANIAAHEMLFRTGMFVDLIEGLQALAFALVVYLLFREFDRVQAALVVILGGVLVAAIYFVNTLTYAGALLFATNTDFLAAFSKPQRDGFAMLFVRLHHYGVLANSVFWGLWLIPLAIVLYKSRSIPRFIEIWLFLNAIPYLALSFTGIIYPAYEGRVWNLLMPLTFGEVAVMLWLVVIGTRSAAAIPVTATAQ
ncbi:MAG TPA: DUF4386 domain-containing protein [Thermoanaerobaculia bacterium]|nr:DUF4386 domain-containing protein [Thermoanaerobaculia bacterium]